MKKGYFTWPNKCHILSFRSNTWVVCFALPAAVSIEVCQPCLPGHFCAEVGLSFPSGPCNSGFYCTEGSRTATPWGNTTGNSLILIALYRVVIHAWHLAQRQILERVKLRRVICRSLTVCTLCVHKHCVCTVSSQCSPVFFPQPLTPQCCRGLHRTFISPHCFLFAVFFSQGRHKMALAFWFTH